MKQAKQNMLIILLSTTILLAGIIATVELIQKPQRLPKDAMTQKLETQERSDEVFAIEQDLNTTDLLYLDKELKDIESELSGF